MAGNKVCAVVVTYNRKGLLLECLEALRNQTRPVDGICLLDNASTDGTPELLNNMGYLTELPPQHIQEPWENTCCISIPGNSNLKSPIYYIRMSENVGGAGGFYEGLKKAFEKGYDWFWLMDDDAEPDKDSLRVVEEYFGWKDISALVNAKVDREGNRIYNHIGYLNFENPKNGITKTYEPFLWNQEMAEVAFSSFVGVLIKRDSIKKIGFPQKEFFIHHDDVEYCIRLQQVGKLLFIPNSIIKHKAETRNIQAKKTIIGETRRIPYEKLWITYYRRRNLVWLVNKYCSKNKLPWLLFYLDLFLATMKKIFGIMLFDDHKLKRIHFLLSAYLDGMRGVFENNKPKNILYG